MKLPIHASKDVFKGHLKDLATRLRERLPLPLRQGVGRAGHFFGSQLVYPSMTLSLRNLARLGFRPSLVVDVGAYIGDWTRLCKTYFPAAKVFMIEAQQGKEALLREVASSLGADVTLAVALLGSMEGLNVSFHEMETGSSVFAEKSHIPRKTAERTTSTLDGVLAAQALGPVDFLKLDVQGYEIEVLKGGTKALSEAEFVLTEASVLPVNEGCPSFEEVVGFMDAAGFRVFDLCDQSRRRDGLLWQVDLLFVRKGSRLAPAASIDRSNWGLGGFF